MIPPPTFTTIEEALAWAHELWLHYKYPDSFQAQYLELQEIAELSVPDDSRGRIQLIDAGSGLSQFIIVFPSGTPVVIARENTDLYNLYEDADALAAVSTNWPYLLEGDARDNLVLTGNITAVNATLSGSASITGNAFVTGNVLETTAATAVGTGAQTLSAAELLGGIIDEDPEGNATWTTDTAENIVAAISGAVVGTTFRCLLYNDATAASGEVVTVAGGTDVTMHGTTLTMTEGTNTIMELTFRITNVTASSEAVDCYVLTHA